MKCMLERSASRNIKYPMLVLLIVDPAKPVEADRCEIKDYDMLSPRMWDETLLA